MAEIETLYWLPHCTTCQKADAFLKDLGIKVKQYVDLKTEGVDRKTVESLSAAVGGPSVLFSKRALKYRSMGLDKLELSDDDLLQHMSTEYTFIKRPVIVVKGGPVLTGWSKKQQEALKALLS